MSSREVRVIQGVDKTDRPYMCHTCSRVHSAKPDGDLNVLVGTSQFHNIHTPRDADATRKEPDPFHIDWVTVCDASITELEHAWYVDYWTSNKPMRILLCGGLEDLPAGKSVTDVIEQILHFKQKVDRQNPRNELVVATLLNPPKYTWFEDNGEPPRNHKNLIREIKELNSWIVKFNTENGKQFTQGRIFYIICGYPSGKSLPFLPNLFNKLGKVTHFWSFLSGKSFLFCCKIFTPARA